MSEKYNQKVREYRDYIDSHILNVKKAYNFYGKDLCMRLHIDFIRLGDMVNAHDQSKYSAEEFEGYRCYFYPTEDELADPDSRAFNKKKFDAAWLHHLRNNAHHPEYWIFSDEHGHPICHPMDPIHVAEMLLDWAGMGIVKQDTAFDYWKSSMNEKPLNRETIALIDSCIDIFKTPIPIE